MTNTLIALALVLILVIVIGSIRNKKEKFTGVYIAQPSKCYQCEYDLEQKKKYMGGPTKCFDCEKQMLAMGKDANLGHNTKCFDCERQMAKF